MAEPLASIASSEPDERASDLLRRGASLGRYELLVPVAVGGMARVWAARLHGQRGFTKLVAIKTVLPHLASDPEFERMLVDEARIASGVRHPNVCEIYDLGEERHVLYIAMEWVYGDSVSHLIKASGAVSSSGGIGLDPRVVARIVSDAAAGLHAAHNLVDDDGRALHVVHRDVSPHNLLVSLDGNVKVTDFGVAKAVGASHQATSAGQLKGKIAYMAPEQATGQPVDRRSDVFALGCVLYEATTGQQPFRGEGEHQVMQELVKGAFAPPSRLVRGYPFELERIVTRALAAQPLHRFQTMEQMRTALEEWISKSGPVVTQTQVAAVVKERLGPEVEKRRERIRAASAAIVERGETFDPAQMTPSGASVRPRGTTPSGVVPTREGSLPPPAPGRISHMALTELAPLPAVIPLAPRAPSAPQYFIAGAIGVLAAAAVGVAGFYVWRTMTPPPSATPAHALASTEPAVPSAVPPPHAPLVVASSAPAAIVRATAPIVFKVIPDKAYFVLDGSATEPTVRTLDRPAPGATRRLVVRADGYVDQTLTIDESAPASIDVWLDALPKKSVSPANKVPTSDTADAKAPEALPANPY